MNDPVFETLANEFPQHREAIRRFMRVETGVDPVGHVCPRVPNRSTGAIGVFQVKPGAAIEFANVKFPEQLDRIVRDYERTRVYSAAYKKLIEAWVSPRNRYNTDALQLDYFRGFINRALKTLAKVNAPPTPLNLYALHNQGMGGGAKLLRQGPVAVLAAFRSREPAAFKEFA